MKFQHSVPWTPHMLPPLCNSKFRWTEDTSYMWKSNQRTKNEGDKAKLSKFYMKSNEKLIYTYTQAD